MHGRARRVGALLGAALLGLVLVGCGPSGAGSDDAAEGSGPFPLTVSTKFGEVRIPERPERVVALGWSDAATALELGVQPVGASDWLDFGGNGVGPWSSDEYTESPELVGTNEINYEAVAALEPDLILNTRSAGSAKTHSTLSGIAPTVGPPKDTAAYGTGWREQLRMVATAVGEKQRGEQLLAETEQAFERAVSEHPALEGKTVGVGAHYGNGYGAYLGEDSRVRFMRELGMRNKPEIAELGSGSFYVDISQERLDVLSADLTVVFAVNGDSSQLRADPLLQRTGAARSGNLVVIDDPRLVKAFSSGSVPGMRYALREVVPTFAEHVAAG
ncbi:iron-siderophore ABC transporter substrate-binding protein [Actinopolyspora saharensis]|uniref:Iron complex transport system substrate-binding protein n=1 Tax=Actinopolyspora saharensis TaxID=995062 RepID=A0A1H1GNR0_9ACTN|nr:iron-siderophore ABC transporter substrate-binding protein [Actinopolyspora saharensis]SDR14789.1 iron complex transport system substrate-binding protein [Actinopolyspora saharensis]